MPSFATWLTKSLTHWPQWGPSEHAWWDVRYPLQWK